jgi:hypothetical protein
MKNVVARRLRDERAVRARVRSYIPRFDAQWCGLRANGQVTSMRRLIIVSCSHGN